MTFTVGPVTTKNAATPENVANFVGGYILGNLIHKNVAMPENVAAVDSTENVATSPENVASIKSLFN